METFLDPVTFPPSRNDLRAIINPFSSNENTLSEFASRVQDNLVPLATILEELKIPVSEDGDTSIKTDSNISQEEATRLKRRQRILEASLAEIDSTYQSMIDIKNYDRISKEAKVKAASEYKFPPGFEDINESNVGQMAFENLAVAYKRNYKRDLDEYENIPKFQKYGQDQGYQQMKEDVWKLFHFDSVAPNPSKEFSDYQESDEDMIIAETRESYKCPLTKQFYVDPVTSKVCKHSFTSDAIRSVLGRSLSIKCPIPSCSHKLKLTDLYPNKELERLTQRAKAREQREHEQSIQGVDTL